jgi:hypothetical protein
MPPVTGVAQLMRFGIAVVIVGVTFGNDVGGGGLDRYRDGYV